MKQTLFAMALSAAIAGASGCGFTLLAEPEVVNLRVQGLVLEYTNAKETTTVPVAGAKVNLTSPSGCKDALVFETDCDGHGTTTNADGVYMLI